jgi:hypothetical protein
MIASISRRIRFWLTGDVPGEAVSLQPAVSTPLVQTPQTTPAAKAVTQTRRKSSPAKREVPDAAPRKGRSTEDTLSRTVELLSSNSQVSAGEVAKSLGISASYARSLLRRARTRVTEQKTPVPATTSTVIKTASSTATASSAAKSSNEEALTGILSRLSAAETELSQLRTRPATKDMRWDLTTRSEVLRRHSAGETLQAIAAALGIPQGQVRFILDVNQILLAR